MTVCRTVRGSSFGSRRLAGLATGLLALSATTAAAQNPPAPPADKPPVTAWRVECSNDGKTLDCRAVQQVVQRETNQVVAVVSVRVPADTKKPTALLQIPLGILVTEPSTLKIDEGQAEKFVIQTCTQQGCFAGGALPDPLLAAMRTGRELKVSFSNLNKQTVIVAMPLAGFALAYDKIK